MSQRGRLSKLAGQMRGDIIFRPHPAGSHIEGMLRTVDVIIDGYSSRVWARDLIDFLEEKAAGRVGFPGFHGHCITVGEPDYELMFAAVTDEGIRDLAAAAAERALAERVRRGDLAVGGVLAAASRLRPQLSTLRQGDMPSQAWREMRTAAAENADACLIMAEEATKRLRRSLSSVGAVSTPNGSEDVNEPLIAAYEAGDRLCSALALLAWSCVLDAHIRKSNRPAFEALRFAAEAAGGGPDGRWEARLWQAHHLLGSIAA